MQNHETNETVGSTDQDSNMQYHLVVPLRGDITTREIIKNQKFQSKTWRGVATCMHGRTCVPEKVKSKIIM